MPVAQRNVVFFRSQDNLSIADQRLLAVKLGELSGKPASSKLHQHPLTDEASELGDEVTIISSQMSGFAEDIYYAGDKSKFARFVLCAFQPRNAF
jgi:alpha-ketoglutarate-dependent taurine dioxygenase